MLDQLDDDNWEAVFAEPGNCSMGNCDDSVETVGDCAVSNAPPLRENVVRILAIEEGVKDEAPWVGLFELNDGRFLAATGSCDYTGWD